MDTIEVELPSSSGIAEIMLQPPLPTQDLPHEGVLSQTLASSPCIKTILPAKIRSALHNDIVLVGHSSIHLREFLPVGQLSNVIASLEFGAQVLAATIISAEEYTISIEDAILANGRDETRYRIRGQAVDDSLPPQIVLVSIASGELVYVYARNLPSDNTRFVHARRHIMGGFHWPSKYGKHLAVDPSSRALAIASSKGSFGLVALKDVDEIKAEIDAWDPRRPQTFQPLKEQRFVQVDGIILRITFLRNNSAEDDKIVLLLVVANQGTTRLLLYRWNAWRPLSTLRSMKGSGYPLPSRDAFPHLLIPSCKSMSFAIMADQRLVFYDNIASKAHRRTEFAVRVPEQDSEKQWVQWAKPVRHEQHKKNKEDIFLIREDGVMSIAVVSLNTPRGALSFEPGQLGIRVDTAVCALSSPPTIGGDTLIVCGDTTDGGVFQLMAREPPKKLQTISNWSPINDMIVLGQRSLVPGHHALALAATGLHDKRASLIEIRFGLEGQIGWTVKHEEANTIDHLWALSRSMEGRLLLLTSHHEHTSMLSYEIDTEELAYEDGYSYPQLCFYQATLAASNLDDDSIFQITTNQLCLLSASSEPAKMTVNASGGQNLCASIEPSSRSFVIASRNEVSAELICGFVRSPTDAQTELTESMTRLRIDFAPVSLDLLQLGERRMCVVGSHDGYLNFYDIDSQNRLSHCQQVSLAEFEPAIQDANIASLGTLYLSGADQALVICGLRSGHVLLLRLALWAGNPVQKYLISLDRSQVWGSTTVLIRTEAANYESSERSAFVACGATLHRVHLYRNRSGLDYTVDSILVTNREDAQYIPPNIQAIDRIGNLSSSNEGNPSGLLACVAGDEILLLGIHPASMLPRPVQMTPPTKNLIYSTQLKRCIVSIHSESLEDGLGLEEEPVERPSIQLVQPAHLGTHEQALLKSRFFFGERGEKVRALLEWSPTDGKVHFDMVIIASQFGDDGRLSYMNMSRLNQPKIGGTARVIATYPRKPVTAVCPYGMSSLLVSADRQLKLLHLDVVSKRWQHCAELELPSPATEIKSKGSFIYVSTSRHSFLLIREENQTFQLVTSDIYAGKAINIVPHSGSSALVNLIDDQGSRILNFARRPVSGSQTTFEARLPQAIDRLAKMKFTPTATAETRERFLGTSIDGTIYLLTTLSGPEIKLLKFLESLCQPASDQPGRCISTLADAVARKYASKLELAGVVPESIRKSTHAHGDLLQALLEPGPYNIHFLLEKGVKSESEVVKEEDSLDRLRELAHPVFNSRGDIVDGLILWLRRLLNVPTA